MSKTYPQTVTEAVDFIMLKLTQADITEIAGLEEKDLRALHFSLGQFIRNETGLWADNTPLLLDCQMTEGRHSPDFLVIHPDEASTVITQALWRQIRG